MQDVVGQEGRGAWHVGEARKVVDVEEHKTVSCLDDIQTINVQSKYFTGAECQLSQRWREWKESLFDVHVGMKW